MNRTQVTAIAFWPLLALLLLPACQTQAGTPVEVTRLVTVLPEPGPVSPEATEQPLPTLPPAATPTPQPTSPPVIVTVEVTPVPLGSTDRPIQLLFPPTTATTVIGERGEALAEALTDATGLAFTVGVPDDEQTLVSLLCAAPGDTIGFVSAAAYVLAHDQCGAQAGLVALGDDGLPWTMGMLVTRRAGAPADLAALEGLRWAEAESTNLTTSLYFRAALAEAGVSPGELSTTPEESSALLALTNNEVDFTTATFVPPIMPLDRVWTYPEDDPEEWRFLGISPTRSPIGYVLVAGEPEFGGYRLRDARSRLFDTFPEIFDQTRILTVSEPIPNETVVLGADFPLAAARAVLAALPAFTATEACQTSICSADFLGWSGVEPVDDVAYNPIRFTMQALDLDADGMWELLNNHD